MSCWAEQRATKSIQRERERERLEWRDKLIFLREEKWRSNGSRKAEESFGNIEKEKKKKKKKVSVINEKACMQWRYSGWFGWESLLHLSVVDDTQFRKWAVEFLFLSLRINLELLTTKSMECPQSLVIPTQTKTVPFPITKCILVLFSWFQPPNHRVFFVFFRLSD